VDGFFEAIGIGASLVGYGLSPNEPARLLAAAGWHNAPRPAPDHARHGR